MWSEGGEGEAARVAARSPIVGGGVADAEQLHAVLGASHTTLAAQKQEKSRHSGCCVRLEECSYFYFFFHKSDPHSPNPQHPHNQFCAAAPLLSPSDDPQKNRQSGFN